MSSCLMVGSGSGGVHVPVSRWCARCIQMYDEKHHSHYYRVELPLHLLVLEQEIKAKRVSIVLRAGAVTGLLSSLTSLHFRVR